MKKTVTAVMMGLMVLGSGAALAAGDAAAGKTKYAMCKGCHGAHGVSKNPNYPTLAGKEADYLTKKLKGFRSKEIKNPTMNAMAAGLSDADIDNLAAYLSSQKP